MFIVIDGLDGSGKGTQTRLVVEALKREGKEVLELDYPRYGEKSAYFIEEYLNGKYGKNVPAKLASLFFALDRFDDSATHKENFSDYDFVVSNRYTTANMIHQAGKIQHAQKRKEFIAWLTELEYEICGIPKPDLVLFLDVPPSIGQKLIAQKQNRSYIKDGNTDLHEGDLEHLANAYDAALEIVASSPEWKKVDCCENGEILPVEDITKKILKYFH